MDDNYYQNLKQFYIIRKTKNLLSQAIPLFLQNYFATNYWKQLDFAAEYSEKKIELIFNIIKIKDPIDNFLEFGGSAGKNIFYLNNFMKFWSWNRFYDTFRI